MGNTLALIVSLFYIGHVVCTQEAYDALEDISRTSVTLFLLIANHLKQISKIKALRNGGANSQDIHIRNLVMIPINVDAEVFGEGLLDKVGAGCLVEFARLPMLCLILTSNTLILRRILDSLAYPHQSSIDALKFTLAVPFALGFVIVEQRSGHVNDLGCINEMGEVILV